MPESIAQRNEQVAQLSQNAQPGPQDQEAIQPIHGRPREHEVAERGHQGSR